MSYLTVRGLVGNREFDDEPRAAWRVVADPDVAIVVGNDGGDDRKAKSRAAFFGRKVRFKESRFVFFGDAAAVVADNERC